MKRPAAAPKKGSAKKLKTPSKPAEKLEDESTAERGPQPRRLFNEKGENNLLPVPALKKPSSSAGSRTPAQRKAVNVIECTIHKCGWKVLQIKTPSGRIYPKWVCLSDENLYCFSAVKAQAAGFVDDPDPAANAK